MNKGYQIGIFFGNLTYINIFSAWQRRTHLFFYSYFFILIWCSNFNSGAQSVTWFEPPPVTTISDRQEVHTSKIQFYEGSINEQLNWRFSVTQTVQVVTLELDDTNVVATITPSTKEVFVSQDFTSRVNVTWATGHVTVVIYKVTTSDKGVFSCQLIVPGNVWRSNIEVAVLGKVIVLLVLLLLLLSPFTSLCNRMGKKRRWQTFLPNFTIL